MTRNIDGFYAGYFSAAGGNGIVLFVIRQGAIVGSDLTSKYDGSYKWNSSTGEFDGTVKVRLDPGGITVQGVPTGPTGLEYEIDLHLPPNFTELPYIKISTPLGPVNARFDKIRDL